MYNLWKSSESTSQCNIHRSLIERDCIEFGKVLKTGEFETLESSSQLNNIFVELNDDTQINPPYVSMFDLNQLNAIDKRFHKKSKKGQ